MNQKTLRSQNLWQAQYYDQSANYVTKLGESLLELLAPLQGEQILDLGCGTGHLTAKISEAGAIVQGIDLSENMIKEAKSLYPSIDFRVENAENFQLSEPVDAVFSNAALHWIKDAPAVIRCVANSLRTGGRFVAEMGGENNVAGIIESLYRALEEYGVKIEAIYNPWYFPSVGEYTSLLESEGFQVTYVHYFERPTWLQNGSNGVADWIQNFAGDFLQAIPMEKREEFIQRTTEISKPHLYKDGKWYADYRRLRFIAIKK